MGLFTWPMSANDDSKKSGGKDVDKNIIKIEGKQENKENSIENKTSGPIYMVFRENNNWDKYAPKIIEHIKQLGGEIETVSFPRGTEKEEIEKWYEENQDKFQGKFLLTDTTCEPQIEEDKFQNKYNLDEFLQDSNRDIINKILKEAFGEDLGPRANQGIEKLKDSYTKMFKLALERNVPKKVTFLVDRSSHHFGLPNNEMKEQSKEYDDAVANFFKKCLLDAGYPEANISMVNDIQIKPEEIESMKNEWFMVDSHCHDILKKFQEAGLDYFEPGDIRKLIVPGEVDKQLLFEVDRNFKKIESPEEFFTLDLNINPFEFEETKIIERVGGEEEWMKIMNIGINLYIEEKRKANGGYVSDEQVRNISLLLFESGILSQKNKEQLEKKLEEIKNIK